MTGDGVPGKRKWTLAEVGDQQNRTALVTGANTGIGFEAARMLASRGVRVVLACRDVARAERAAARIAADTSGSPPGVLRLDLASLDSIREAVGLFRAENSRLDLLVNNAGVMWPPYGRTADGFELQFGINHLGHFALTGLLLELMLPVPGSRVVTVSSSAHRQGRMYFDDLHGTRGYRPVRAYAQSKLANLLFTFELQRRMSAADVPTIAVAAHPGVARTDLVRHAPGPVRLLASGRLRWLSDWLLQEPAMGALPTVRAAVDPGAAGGGYYGPSGWAEMAGDPVPVEAHRRAHDGAAQRRLWQESERLTSVRYPLASGSEH
ncbi:SDR family NAD(P)-dependent oxidoreductase [Plantactinospora sp. S1510]|uniref:SDR family NAD(P)-dependent oxidoreductase n=1 Tax=Plantactinospora alkalitolerans TaxID=2789879 RepID=A0ABS0H4Z3_9ACTN|nr:oxidoreductase [Plantactinospora alkalitolerans]MBF9133381.1 SDR family NAD(P)-dependent oxidoreductase [Plantactinospora alkalitolerans]